MGSESSSPDERCPHVREGGCCSSPGYCCHACEAPADAETAGEPEQCPCPANPFPDCRCPPNCHVCHPEPEAPECSACGGSDPETCPFCKQVSAGPWITDDEIARQGLADPPRRPPYAVAYETEGGAQYEIALPGDATIRAHEGALLITHASAVTALTQARPMES